MPFGMLCVMKLKDNVVAYANAFGQIFKVNKGLKGEPFKMSLIIICGALFEVGIE